MTIYVVANTKGGVGKTTLALNIGATLIKSFNRDVALVNGDRQPTLNIAVRNRTGTGASPIMCPHYSDGKELRQQVELMRPKFDDIVIDVGGRDSTAMRAALMLGDVVVVPFQPRSFDVWALDDIQPIVEEVMVMREPCHMLAVLNMADPSNRSADNDDSAAMVTNTPFVYLDTPLRRRKVYADAAGQGLSILEAARRDPKATVEFEPFMELLVSIAATTPVWKAYETADKTTE